MKICPREKKNMDNNLMRAKELFFRYCGSFFFMDREGDYGEYKMYNISKETELQWIEEMVDGKVKQLSFDNTTVFFNLGLIASNYYTHNNIVEKIVKTLLNFVSNNIDSLDSLFKLIYAETLLEIPCFSKELTRAKIEGVMELLQRVLSNPISVNKDWEKRLPAEFLGEKAIRDRLNRDLKRAKDIQERFC